MFHWFLIFFFSPLLRTPDLGYDFDSNSGRVFNYYCYGVACSEVEIDCLTGAHKVCTCHSQFGPKIGFIHLGYCKVKACQGVSQECILGFLVLPLLLKALIKEFLIKLND